MKIRTLKKRQARLSTTKHWGQFICEPIDTWAPDAMPVLSHCRREKVVCMWNMRAAYIFRRRHRLLTRRHRQG